MDSPKSMRLAKELVSSYIQSLDDRHNGVRHHIPCGFPSLDKTLPGWLHKGHLIIVAGRPAMGKSVFAQQVTEQVAGQGHTSIF